MLYKNVELFSEIVVTPTYINLLGLAAKMYTVGGPFRAAAGDGLN